MPESYYTRKKQQIAERTSLYEGTLEEGNVLRNAGLTMEQFDAYDSGQMDEQECALFRERLKEIMLVDQGAASILKAQYKDIWESMKETEDRLKTDASRTGIDKVRHDIMGKKKAEAQARQEEISRAKSVLEEKKRQQVKAKGKDTVDELERLKQAGEEVIRQVKEQERQEAKKKLRKKLGELSPQIEKDFEKAQKEVIATVAMELKEVPVNPNPLKPGEEPNMEPAKTLEEKEERLKIIITDDMTEDEKRHALGVNESIHQKYNDLGALQVEMITKYNLPQGLFMKKTSMYSASKNVLAINPLTTKFHLAHPEFKASNVGTEDIHRDVCRWSSPLWKAHEATDESLTAALTAMKGIHGLKGKKPEEITDKETAKKHMEYAVGRMELFAQEIDEVVKTLPKSLIGKNPEYADLVEHSFTINEVYRKSQSLRNVGKEVLESPAFSLLTAEQQASAKEAQAKIRAMSIVAGYRVSRGKQMAKASVDKNDDAPLADEFPAMQSYDELLEQYRKE